MNNDFHDFASSKEAFQDAPKSMGLDVLSFVKKDLLPASLFSTLLKLFSIQLVIGTLTTLICPQFQLSFIKNADVYHYFHHNFGEFGCMSLCGIIFISFGAFSSSFFLSPSQRQLIHSKNILFYLMINLIFLALFKIIGAQLTFVPSLFWILGALLSGILFFEAGRNFKIFLFSS